MKSGNNQVKNDECIKNGDFIHLILTNNTRFLRKLTAQYQVKYTYEANGIAIDFL